MVKSLYKIPKGNLKETLIDFFISMVGMVGAGILVVVGLLIIMALYNIVY